MCLLDYFALMCLLDYRTHTYCVFYTISHYHTVSFRLFHTHILCLLNYFILTYCVFYTIQVAGGGQHSAIIGKVVTAAWEIESDEE